MGEEVCPKVKSLGIVWVGLIELLLYLVERLYRVLSLRRTSVGGLVLSV